MSQAGLVTAGNAIIPADVATAYVTDDGTAVPAANTLDVLGQKAGTIPVVETHAPGGVQILTVEDRTWLTPLVVDPSAVVGLQGTFTTIAAATAAAVFGQVIFIRPGTYVENITLKSGVSYKGFTPGNMTPTQFNDYVVVTGQIVEGGVSAGAVTFENIFFQNTVPGDIVVTTAPFTHTLCFYNCAFGISTHAFNWASQGTVKLFNCGLNSPIIVNHASAKFYSEDCIFGANTAHTISNGLWMDQSSFGIQIVNLSNAGAVQFYGTTFGGLTGGGTTSNIIGSSSGVNILSGCTSFSTVTNPMITASGTFLISNISNKSNALAGGGGLYSSTPTIRVGHSQAGNIIRGNVQTGASYVVNQDDYYVGINHAGTVAVTLPTTNTPIDRVFIIKDESGAAGLNNITITPASGTIDGAANFVMNNNYESITVKFDGTNYFIL